MTVDSLRSQLPLRSGSSQLGFLLKSELRTENSDVCSSFFSGLPQVDTEANAELESLIIIHSVFSSIALLLAVFSSIISGSISSIPAVTSVWAVTSLPLSAAGPAACLCLGALCCRCPAGVVRSS